MEIEKPKGKKVGAVKKLHSFATDGQTMIQELMDIFQFKRTQELATLLDVSDKALLNWAKKSENDMSKWSARLKALYEAVQEFKKARLPESSYLGLITNPLIQGSSKSILSAIRTSPDNELIQIVIKLFSERMASAIPRDKVLKTLNENNLSDADQKSLKEKYKS